MVGMIFQTRSGTVELSKLHHEGVLALLWFNLEYFGENGCISFYNKLLWKGTVYNKFFGRMADSVW